MLKETRSLSTWSLQAKSPPVMDPSEKFSHKNRIDLIGIDTALEKEKQFSDMDMGKYVCVNPYEITDLNSPMVTVDVPLKAESSVVQQNVSVPSVSGFCGSQGKIKLEMEEFGDLTSFLPRHTLTNSIDELNTPVFEKDAFDFDISNYQMNNEADFFVKLEYDAPCRYNNSIPEKTTNFFNKPLEVHRNESIPSEIRSNDNIHLQQKSDTTLYSPLSDNGTYISAWSPSTASPSTVSCDMNDSALSVISRHCSYPPSPDGVFLFPNRVETPDDSFNSHDSRVHKRKLSVDVNLKASSVTDIVSTPNIIAQVVDLEAENFNILDLCKYDNIPLVSTEDIFGESILTQSQSKIVNCEPVTENKPENHPILPKQPRKRRRSEEYDEDYTPPTPASHRSKNQMVTESSDSEYDPDVDDSKPKYKRKGRPPKRTRSISSNHSKDSDSFKYRELRDKNNEASRKSRLKRKMKEHEIEVEAEDLAVRNIRLIAQVEELEKMVKSYKDSIFKIMLNK